MSFIIVDVLQYWLFQINIGVSGQIVDKDTGDGIAKAVISVDGINHNIAADEHGYFWRLLVPGTYKLKVSAQG